jgi:hypothetical protein
MLRRIVRSLKTNSKYAIGLLLASIIGGASTAVVLAAIPDSSGLIHSCTTNGFLPRTHIIDSATQNCNGNETAVNWQQSAGGSVYSKALVAPVGQTSVSIFTLPGFGSFTNIDCDPVTAPHDTVRFTNTTSHVVYSSLFTSVQPGTYVDFALPVGSQGPTHYAYISDQHYMLNYDAGAGGQRTASLWLGGQFGNDPTSLGCSMRAQAVVSLN